MDIVQLPNPQTIVSLRVFLEDKVISDLHEGIVNKIKNSNKKRGSDESINDRGIVDVLGDIAQQADAHYKKLLEIQPVQARIDLGRIYIMLGNIGSYPSMSDGALQFYEGGWRLLIEAGTEQSLTDAHLVAQYVHGLANLEEVASYYRRNAGISEKLGITIQP